MNSTMQKVESIILRGGMYSSIHHQLIPSHVIIEGRWFHAQVLEFELISDNDDEKK